MKLNVKSLLAIIAITIVSACSGTLPVEYTAQSFGKLNNSRANMGNFTYRAATIGKVKTNQIQNTAIGDIMIGEDVSSYVRRATALELEKAGTVITSQGNTIEAEITNLLADDLGYSVRWSYSVKYVIKKPSGNVVFSKEYAAKNRKTGKFGQPSDFTSTFNLLILDSIEQLMADVRNQSLLR